MKRGAQICLSIFVVAVLLAMVQLWLAPMSSALFTKVLMSLGGLFLISGAATLVIHEYGEQQRLKDSGHID